MRLAALILGLTLWPLLAGAQPRKVDTTRTDRPIGSWVLSCTTDPMTDAQQCRLREKLWVVVPDNDHPGLAFEVIQRYGQLVPALTARNLSLGNALGGLLTLTATAQIRFDGRPLIALPCMLDGTTVICAPSKDDATAAADELALARTVLVRLRPFGNLPLPVPDEPVALDLDRTPEALASFRAAGPTVETAPPESIGDDIKNFTDRMMRRFGLGGPDTPPAK